MPLTEIALRKAKASAKPARLFDGGGLYLEIAPSGGKWWRFKYRFAEKEKRLSLGVYPEVSLKAARAKRDDARRLLADGIDPSEHRQQSKSALTAKATNGFEAVARCRASIVVSMVAHRAINHATMLVAFLSVLDTVLASVDDLRPSVLHWLPAQRVMPFATYRLLRMELGPCGPAINVRIARINESQTVADTVGLADLGLPDLQTLATGRDPAALAFRLVHLARAMFVGDKLDCVWVEEGSFSPPRRDALTIQLD